jgi:hypothetical protein
MGWLPALKTPLSAREAARELAAASGLRGAALALAIAQSALETDQWQRLWRCNFGNLKATTGQDFQTLRTSERINGKTVWFSPEGQTDGKDGPIIGERWGVPPGHPQTRFAAYPTPAAGASAWWALLNRPRYAAALVELRAGRARDFAREAGRAGYYTAKPEEYAAGLVALQRQFLPLAVQIAPGSGRGQTGPGSSLTRGGGSGGGAGVALLLLGVLGAAALVRRKGRP